MNDFSVGISNVVAADIAVINILPQTTAESKRYHFVKFEHVVVEKKS